MEVKGGQKECEGKWSKAGKGGEKRMRGRNRKRTMDKGEKRKPEKCKKEKEGKESDVNIRDGAAVLSGRFKHLEHLFESLAES